MGVNSPNILLAGASGLIGGLVLRRLLANRSFSGMVFAPSRRELPVSDSRVVAPVIDFASAQAGEGFDAGLQRYLSQPIDVFISCLGTTIKAAGSRQAFIAVDRELVFKLAQFAQMRGARHAILVSSVGASRQSGNFYLRVKGEVEDAMEKRGFARLDTMQPGLLIGDRDERRPAEALAQKLAPLANAAMLGKLRRYRSIEADTLAHAIVALVERDEPGVFTHEYDSIRAVADSA